MRPETRAAPSASLALRPLLLGLAAAVALLAGCGAARAADGPVAAGDLIAGPYVNSASVTSAKVLWLARPGVQARCEVSAEPASAGQQPKVEIKSAPLPGRLEVLYTATLAGLQPGLSYRYRVVCGAARADGSFQTPPPKGSQTPVKFVVYSDPHSQPERHRAVAEAVMKELPLAFLEVTGDLTDDGTLPELEEGFFDSARDLLRRTALWTARGNHEKEGLLYRALFDLPNNELYYSFDVGNIHWVVLDPYEEGGLRQRRGKQLDDMLAWLDQDLAGARAEWLIVAYHTPTINVGGHGSLWGYERLLPILLKHGVDLIISGHSHLYERIRPIGLEGQKPLIQIVSGGSGGETYPIAPSPVLAASYSGLHYCLFTVKGNRLEMTAKTPDGRALDTLVLVKSDGKFQSEVMAAALTPEQAMPLVKVFKLARVEFQAVPKAGQPAAALVPGDSFPKGWRVEIAKAQDCPWEVQPASFEAAGATLKLMVTPPQGTKLAATLWMGTFDPELRLRVRLARGSENYTCDSVTALVPAECLEKLVPAPKPVDVPRAAGAITVDGDAADWAGVAGLYLPSAASRGKRLRLAWRADGLYGLLSADDNQIAVNAKEPWTADCLELDFEMDAARRVSIRDDTPTGKLLLYPQPSGDGGRAGLLVHSGRFFRNNVTAAWKRTRRGYDLEFLISPKALAPAKLATGDEIGFHFVLCDAGKAVEQFVDTSAVASAWRTPIFWGALRLAE